MLSLPTLPGRRGYYTYSAVGLVRYARRVNAASAPLGNAATRYRTISTVLLLISIECLKPVETALACRGTLVTLCRLADGGLTAAGASFSACQAACAAKPQAACR